MKMKTVRPGRAEVVHVETDLGIVNIYVGLRDRAGRRVERVELIPNRYAGEKKVRILGPAGGARFIESLTVRC